MSSFHFPSSVDCNPPCAPSRKSLHTQSAQSSIRLGLNSLSTSKTRVPQGLSHRPYEAPIARPLGEVHEASPNHPRFVPRRFCLVVHSQVVRDVVGEEGGEGGVGGGEEGGR